MDLLRYLNDLCLWRPMGVPANLGTVCVIASKDSIWQLEKLREETPGLEIGSALFVGLSHNEIASTRLEIGGKKIPVEGIEGLAKYSQYSKIFLVPEDAGFTAHLLTHIARYMASFDENLMYLYGQTPPSYTVRPALPDYYETSGQQLEEAYALFNDDPSRRIFTGCIKAIMSGNSGYIPVSPFQEYFHPLIHPEEGDIMLDGGVSDMVGSQKEFANAVGSGGMVIGFEPIPSMAESARHSLRGFANYRLETAGLADKPGDAIFDSLRDSSHISGTQQAGEGKIACKLTTVDVYCRAHALSRINCIKLDVEGAELAALKGAKETILRRKPKLIVCLYHKPCDLYELPLYIKQLVPEYEMLLGHSSCQFMDTILYARVRSK